MGTSSASYTQANRLLSIDTPLGKDVLLLQGLTGHEGISRLFSFHLDLLAHDKNAITFKDIVGQNVTITIRLTGGTPRYINGYVSRFAQGATDDRYFTHYTAEVVPWLWFLTRQADCRIFQNLKAPDIIANVFNQFTKFPKFQNKLTGSYPQLEYCVQYRETAFNFVSRLMEENGIFYYFDHSTQGQHTLVMADSSNTPKPCPSTPVSYGVKTAGLEGTDVIDGWHVEQELETGKYSVTDYNFTTPSTSLAANSPTVVSVSPNQSLEIFDYPGLYPTKDIGDGVAKVRMQEEEARSTTATGSSSCRGFMSGYTFKLQNHYRSDQNGSYLLTEVHHVASAGTTYTAGREATEHYSNDFTCIPSSVSFRPARVTPKPFVQGPQPAMVVGPSGEEIWTDKYGRVKVQFYWDRQGKKNENSSCWIRVSQPWAGKQWGAIWIPRIEQEVVVSFLEGDPDRPIIIGRVYNAEQMPPYALPANQTQSTFKSRSSKGGSADNFNEIRFEDKKGSEEIFIQAEKDMNVVVENNETLKVGSNKAPDGSRTHEVYKDDTLTVKTGNRKVEVQQGNDDHTVKTGNRTVEVSTGNDTHTVKTGNRLVEVNTGNDDHKVKMGNRGVEISMGNDSLKISMGNQTTKLDLGASSTEAMQSITLKVGQNSLTIDQMGVTIKGMMISVQGQIQTEVKGTLTTVSADAMLTVKGGITMIN